MSLRRHSDDFRGRRVDLGIGTREMAAGVDVGHGRLLTMEMGKARTKIRPSIALGLAVSRVGQQLSATGRSSA
jgi:hypothetical protein